MPIEKLIAGLVAAVWAIVVLASLFLQNYTVLGATTPVMMLVAGFLFSRKTNGRDKP